MADRSLHRRDFLRLSLVLTGSAWVAACQNQNTQSVPTPAATKGIMPETSGIQLKGGDADAWTFHKALKGSLKNPADCKVVFTESDKARVEATSQEYFFSADVPISP